MFCLTSNAISPDLVAVDLCTRGAALGLGAAGFFATMLEFALLLIDHSLRL